MSTHPGNAPTVPEWPHCGHGADPATDPIGCRGIHVPGRTACLAHLTDSDRATYFSGLAPGANVDHSGTLFTETLLNTLLQALRDPSTGQPHIGGARFGGATFSGDADFGGATFTGAAVFEGATFSGGTEYGRARFTGAAGHSGFGGTDVGGYANYAGRAAFGGGAVFDGATFVSGALFAGASFAGHAGFHGATFCGSAGFAEATFAHHVDFATATFSGPVGFVGATFSGGAGFRGATFSGGAGFSGATFSGDAEFGGATFSGAAAFSLATFTSTAEFSGAAFSGGASFDEATFSGEADFARATFSVDEMTRVATFSGTVEPGGARFTRATFSGGARFNEVTFIGPTMFGWATFTGAVWFGGATFSGDAWFNQVRFALLSSFGPLKCAGTIDLSGAVFEAPVTMEIDAGAVLCIRTRWESTASLRLRHATVDLSDAVLTAPVAVTAHPAPFTGGTDENQPAGAETEVWVASVRGVDAAHLVLSDTNLSGCLFSGAFHLDQLRLEGRCVFAPTPTGLHRWHHVWPYRWTRRRTLAEEHHWRALTADSPAPPRGWQPGPHHPDPGLTPGPEDIAATYRQLRKGFEDSKNEPGAADLYYGEMEMRRHDRVGTPAGERGLLWGYWLLSGYGLRASRALAWLIAAMASTVLILMLWGLPTHDPEPETTGVLSAGHRITLTTVTPDPAVTGHWHRRLTIQRAEKATRVVVNSVVFRSSGQNLTTTGIYTEMVSRIFEPVLLALAALAVRGRIKR
ncbi:pentapeptide repeat-containing protein [Streptomyces sp. YU58]|uniref:pentapeptide repeat-containing protein n=1 Tax=Streptomyces sp. SX92 TaxID=3158972 RepID=UPI0027B97272|nr:pentapeptide repeat-containing protein [Streptomyces coralus]WLW55218.1 pentapeptide repeat-containing protein [Streptomyces coralus]